MSGFDGSKKRLKQRHKMGCPANIAEGAERNSRPDFIRFLNIAKGSAMPQCLINCPKLNTED
jgi:hypothetical protein